MSVWNYFFTDSPVELYKFTCGEAVYSYIASSVKSYTYDGIVYESEYMVRTSVSYSSDFAKDVLTVTVPSTNAVARMFIESRPEFPLYLTVYRGSYHTGNFEPIWNGLVTGAGFTYSGSAYSCDLECETKASRMERMGLIRKYQLTCPYTLFSTECGASLVGATTSAIVASVDGYNVTFTSTPTNISHYVVGQLVRSDGSRRYITSYDGDTLIMERSFASLTVGETVALYKGCDKSTDTCINRFNNVINFGGFPYIPETDVFTSTIG